jgi:hypothetical protein
MTVYPTRWNVISNYVGGDDVIYQACRQTRALGQRVAVGRDANTDRWHVRILGPAEVRV